MLSPKSNKPHKSIAELERENSMLKAEVDDLKHKLERMNEIYKENGLPVLKKRMCLSGSDAAYVTEHGIPCVDNLGTEGGNIHSVDEYIRLDSLVESAKRIACLIYCI